MNRYRMQFAPQVWKPSLRPTLVRCLRSFRVRHQQRALQLDDVTVHGSERLRQALDEGCGVMLMPNHPNHADPFTIYMAGDAADTPFHISKRTRFPS
jgi:lauroyl/myristoyl acyltransferase